MHLESKIAGERHPPPPAMLHLQHPSRTAPRTHLGGFWGAAHGPIPGSVARLQRFPAQSRGQRERAPSLWNGALFCSPRCWGPCEPPAPQGWGGDLPPHPTGRPRSGRSSLGHAGLWEWWRSGGRGAKPLLVGGMEKTLLDKPEIWISGKAVCGKPHGNGPGEATLPFSPCFSPFH